MDSGKKVYEDLSPIWGKNAHVGVKKSFFKIFTIVMFIYLHYPIIIHISKKILRVDSEKKVYEVLGPICAKKYPLVWKQKDIFQKIYYFHLCPLAVVSANFNGLKKLCKDRNFYYQAYWFY